MSPTLSNPIKPPFLTLDANGQVNWRTDRGLHLPVARHLLKMNYQGEKSEPSISASTLSEPLVTPEDQQRRCHELPPKPYLTSAGLLAAINVALTLGKPLFVSGEPGTGKTQLADYLAHCLDLGAALTYTVKSSTQAKDLFYHYDAMQHFNDIHLKQSLATASELESQPASQADSQPSSTSALDYIRCEALGKAILMGSDNSVHRQLLSSEEQALGQKRSLILIDEIDKAPRDVPNDILAELESLTFDIREWNERDAGERQVKAKLEYSPIIIFASNSEKSLPPAFLRRCVYFHINPLS